jgi:transcriptional regulator with XRE-family HTH domain
VPLPMSEVRGIVERVCARRDVLDACARRDLGAVITVLNAHGLTQGQIAGLTGLTQGRLSEWAGGKRKPQAATTFLAFADGLGMPTAAHQLANTSSSPDLHCGDGRGCFPQPVAVAWRRCLDRWRFSGWPPGHVVRRRLGR